VNKVEGSVFINRQPQQVFDFISDPANYPKWQSGTESAEWTSDGPRGVGSTWKVVTKFLGRRIEANIEVTAWDPPHHLAFKATGGPIPFEATVRLEAQGSGTLVNETGQAEFGGFFKLAEGLVAKQMEKEFEDSHAALKQALESSPA